jgi:hypothetical protein
MNEFLAVREVVADGFRLGRYAGRRHPFAVCQLLVLPAFENWIGWDVIVDVSPQAWRQTRLYRSCWRKDMDSAAFAEPLERARHPYPYPPTVEVGWVFVDRGRVEGLLSRLREITVPLGVVPEVTTDDGVGYEFAFGPYNANVRLAWNCVAPPQEWREVQTVADGLLQVFEEAWAAGKEATQG